MAACSIPPLSDGDVAAVMYRPTEDAFSSEGPIDWHSFRFICDVRMLSINLQLIVRNIDN